MSKRNTVRTNVHIDHVLVDGVKHYQGFVSIAKVRRTDICTPVMKDGVECLRVVESLEAKVLRGEIA
jgi:hypothetical protein